MKDFSVLSFDFRLRLSSLPGGFDEDTGNADLGRHNGRGNGDVVTLGGKRVYFAGDTECTPEMKALRGVEVRILNWYPAGAGR